MTERPILFSAPMVRALLAGTKTQTRRALRDGTWWTPEHGVIRMAPAGLACTGFAHVACPYGKPGNRLWVRETWAQHGLRAVYRADGDERPTGAGAWRPSIHMPRKLSRITLEVTGVRVERLQDISTSDCWAEGIPSSPDVDPLHEYRDLWESINGTGSWDANPWVWVVEFKRLEG